VGVKRESRLAKNDDYQAANRLPMSGLFAVVRAPAGMQRLLRTVHLHAERAVAVSEGVSERRRIVCALAEFLNCYNQRWAVPRLGYLTPAQARHQLLALGAAA